jgi:hypothetical protein
MTATFSKGSKSVVFCCGGPDSPELPRNPSAPLSNLVALPHVKENHSPKKRDKNSVQPKGNGKLSGINARITNPIYESGYELEGFS